MSSPPSWDLQIEQEVLKACKKMPRHDAAAILGVIRSLPADPYFGDIRKMQGEESTWRRRIGAYRIFYEIRTVEKILLVFRIERRTSKTY